MNVWKIGSRWSSHGAYNSSVLDLFLKYQFVFNGRDQERIIKCVKKGDYIAVSDGYSIVAVGIVQDPPKPITEFKIEEEDKISGRINYEDWVICIKTKLYGLTKWFTYKKRRAFHALKGNIAQDVINLYDGIKSDFNINAKTATLCSPETKNKISILNKHTQYVIPIYQRPYSWNSEQINKFISDIFTSFWGIDGNSKKAEPMFIGTMQLSQKIFIDIRKGMFQQEIIDGQQRLTTIFIFLKVLQDQFSINSKVLKDFNFNWLKTRVNNGQQQILMNKFLSEKMDNNDETLNPYIKNAKLISEAINEQIINEETNAVKTNFQIDKFIKHLFENVYFVIIETCAGLSKTLQIFDSINTTGLDLNGGDIFKIRMYEYLTDKKNYGENAFEKISSLYEKIDNYNSNIKRNITDIRGILSIYQYILIAKYKLPRVLYSYGVDTFFERLFDTIFQTNIWDNFKNINNIELTLEDLNRIIDLRYDWEENNRAKAEDDCIMNLFWWSRYSRYWILVFLFLFRFLDEENCYEKLRLFTKQLCKVYFIFSVIRKKAINDLHRFTYELIEILLNDEIATVFQKINSCLESKDLRKKFEHYISINIIDNVKKKNLICRLSAMLDEDYKSIDKEKSICNKIFYTSIDIEHIQAFHDKNVAERDNIRKEWGDEINSLGNLAVLESSINRSISNKEFQEKIKGYSNSTFKVIKNVKESNSKWGKNNCIERKHKEVDKIMKYIFSQQ